MPKVILVFLPVFSPENLIKSVRIGSTVSRGHVRSGSEQSRALIYQIGLRLSVVGWRSEGARDNNPQLCDDTDHPGGMVGCLRLLCHSFSPHGPD